MIRLKPTITPEDPTTSRDFAASPGAGTLSFNVKSEAVEGFISPISLLVLLNGLPLGGPPIRIAHGSEATYKVAAYLLFDNTLEFSAINPLSTVQQPQPSLFSLVRNLVQPQPAPPVNFSAPLPKFRWNIGPVIFTYSVDPIHWNPSVNELQSRPMIISSA